MLEVSKQCLRVFLQSLYTPFGAADPRGWRTGSGTHFTPSCFNFHSKPHF